MVEIIAQDIYDTFAYLETGLLSSIFLTMLIVLLRYFHTKSYSMVYALKCMVFIFYLVMLIQIALLSREAGSRTTTDLIPFSTWGTSAQSRAYEYENILMFLPMGFLLPAFSNVAEDYIMLVWHWLCSVVLLNLHNLLRREVICRRMM